MRLRLSCSGIAEQDIKQCSTVQLQDVLNDMRLVNNLQYKKMFKQGQLNLFVEKHVSVAGKNFRQCGVAYAQV